MNRFERWFLKRLLKQEVRQSLFHHIRITALYQAIRDAARKEFMADNDVTLDDVLHERFMLTVCGDFAATHDSGKLSVEAELELAHKRATEVNALHEAAKRLGFSVKAIKPPAKAKI